MNREPAQQKILVWGDNSHGKLGVGNGAEQITKPLKMPFMKEVLKVSIGQNHIAIISAEGQLFTCGDNSRGQLGIGTNKIRSAVYPTMVSCFASLRVSDVACGSNHLLVATSQQTVYSCGANDLGQLGIGSQTDIFEFQQLQYESLKVSAGYDCSFVIADDKVYACGDNSNGQLGLSRSVYSSFGQLALGPVSDIKTARSSTLVLLVSGKVLQSNEQGFQTVNELKNIAAIAAGTVMGAVDCNGDLYTWQDGVPTKQKGTFADICIGQATTGLARDQKDNVYEWGLESITALNKKADLISQGGNSSVMVLKKVHKPQIETNYHSFKQQPSSNSFQTEPAYGQYDLKMEHASSRCTKTWRPSLHQQPLRSSNRTASVCTNELQSTGSIPQQQQPVSSYRIEKSSKRQQRQKAMYDLQQQNNELRVQIDHLQHSQQSQYTDQIVSMERVIQEQHKQLQIQEKQLQEQHKLRRENIELTKAVKHCKEQLHQELNQQLKLKQKQKDVKAKLRQCRNEKQTATSMVHEGNQHIAHLQTQLDGMHTQVQNLCKQIKDQQIDKSNSESRAEQFGRDKYDLGLQVETLKEQIKNLQRIIEEQEFKNKQLNRLLDQKNLDYASQLSQSLKQIIQKPQSLRHTIEQSPRNAPQMFEPRQVPRQQEIIRSQDYSNFKVPITSQSFEQRNHSCDSIPPPRQSNSRLDTLTPEVDRMHAILMQPRNHSGSDNRTTSPYESDNFNRAKMTGKMVRQELQNVTNQLAEFKRKKKQLNL